MKTPILSFVDPRLYEVDPEICKLLGFDEKSWNYLQRIKENFPSLDFFSAKFMSKFDYMEVLALTTLDQIPNGNAKDYAAILEFDEKEVRGILERAYEKDVVKRDRNKEEEEPRYSLNLEKIKEEGQKENESTKQKLLKVYEKIQGPVYQCQACSNSYTFDQMYDNNGTCGCGSKDLQYVEKSPKRDLVAHALKVFFDVKVEE
jgi:transcription initiation factor IIE alpha subunit